MHHIYRITNTVNHKVYIGQTNHPKQRWSQHKHSAKTQQGRDNQVIARAIAKYGAENFKFEVIASFETLEEVNMAECQMIEQYNSRDPKVGYNVDVGGRAERAPEIGLKISAGLKKHYETHESKLTGRKHTEEAKQKMSSSSMGKPGTNKGKTFDPEWCLKIAKGNVGVERKSIRRFTDEMEQEICQSYIEGMSAAAVGRKFDCGKTLVTDILIRSGVEIRPSYQAKHSNGRNLFTKKQELEICRLYNEGQNSQTDLARQFECHPTTIRDILLRHKVKL